MLFRQLFDKTSSTYTYLLASRAGAEALLIDPVFEHTNRYLKLLEELDLKLVKVVDTHVHADHVSAMGSLRDATRCVTVMGEQSPVDIVSMRVRDNDPLTIEGLKLTALHTPGHTSESYSFLMDAEERPSPEAAEGLGPLRPRALRMGLRTFVAYSMVFGET